jgi:hypothetical protein
MARGKKNEGLPAVTAGPDGLDVAAEVPEAGVPTEESLYAIRALRVDKFNIKRTRVKVTPAVCQRCGLDLVAHNAERLGQATWDKLSPGVQETLKLALEEHIKRAHSVAELQVVPESKLQREWLGK